MFIKLSGNYYIKSLPRCFAIGPVQKDNKGEDVFIAKWYYGSLRSALGGWIEEKMIRSKAKDFKALKNEILALNDEMDKIINKINKGVPSEINSSEITTEISELKKKEEIDFIGSLFPQTS